MADKTNTVRLAPSEQAASSPRLYEMSMRFACDARIPSVDDMLDYMGMAEKPVARNAVTLRVSQTVPFVPDEATLRKYANALEGTKYGDAMLANVRFDGYDYFYAVAPAERPGTEITNER